MIFLNHNYLPFDWLNALTSIAQCRLESIKSERKDSSLKYLPQTKSYYEHEYSKYTIDILETRSSPHKGTAIADITSKMITEMAYRW